MTVTAKPKKLSITVNAVPTVDPNANKDIKVTFKPKVRVRSSKLMPQRNILNLHKTAYGAY